MNKFVRKYTAIFLMCTMILCMCACGAEKTPAGETEKVCAKVIEVEEWGHAVLDITTADIAAKGYELGDVVSVRFGSYEAEMPFYDGYYLDPGEVMLRGSAPEKNIALCINYGNFSEENGIKPGDTVEITMAEKAGMLAVQELCSLKYSDDPADYSNDETFANFRAVTAGRIGDGKLYRSASPIDNSKGRASYANALIEKAGVLTILNLSDSKEEIEGLFKEDTFASEYYRALYEKGNVKAINLGSDFFSEEFAASVAEGFRFLAKNDPPYSLHCIEGKDRTGFASMLLAALMGADLDEIIDDYMLTFYNYYGIDKENEPEKHQAVLDNNLIAILCHVTGAENEAELSDINLEEAVTEFLLKAGMAESDISALKEKLS